MNRPAGQGGQRETFGEDVGLSSGGGRQRA
jgi:hypothetical protein